LVTTDVLKVLSNEESLELLGIIAFIKGERHEIHFDVINKSQR
jgi:hypothetical protein